MQGRWLRFTVRGSRTPTTRKQKLSRRLLGNARGPCRPSRRAAVTSLFIRTPIRSQTNRKFYAPASLLPENVVYRAFAHATGEWQAKHRPIIIKTHKRRAQSIFRVGFDLLRKILLAAH